MPRDEDKVPGSIEGLQLPPQVWEVLARENIKTINQLKAAVDRIERLSGMERRTAQMIRDEVSREAPPEQPHFPDKSQFLSPWGA